MSQAQRPLFNSHACAESSSALQQSPKQSEASIAAPMPERQDDSKNAIMTCHSGSEPLADVTDIGDSGNAEGESNNASNITIEEAMAQSEGLRQTSSRLPGEGVEIPTVAFRTIIFGFMRRLFKEIEDNSERARIFAQKCSSKLALEDLQTIARFQGQLGSSETLGGDPPYPVAENMEISRRYALYKHSRFDREGTEDAFRRLFQAVGKTAAGMNLEKLEKYASAKLREMDDDAMVRTSI